MVRSEGSFMDTLTDPAPVAVDFGAPSVQVSALSLGSVLLGGVGYLYGYQRSQDFLNDNTLLVFAEKIRQAELSLQGRYDHLLEEPTELIKRELGQESLDSFVIQYTHKIKTSVVPDLVKYPAVPSVIACGFAGYMLFMKAVKYQNGIYYGERNGEFYPIQCDKASAFYIAWQLSTISEVAGRILGDKTLWGSDLTQIEGFEENVKAHLTMMLLKGVRQAIAQC